MNQNLNDNNQEHISNNDMENIFDDKEKKPLDKKKIAIIAGIVLIALIIIILVIVLLTKDKKEDNKPKEENNNEEPTEVVLTPEEQINEYGTEIELIVQNYVTENGKLPTFEDIEEEVDALQYNITCQEFEIYLNQKIYLNQCSIDNSEATYSYGEKQEEENIDLKIVSASLYEGYTDVKITALKKYNPYIEYVDDASKIEYFAYIANENPDEDGTDIGVEFEFLNDKIYLTVNGISYEIAGIDNPKEVIALDTGCSSGEYMMYILTNNGSVYSFDIWDFDLEEHTDTTLTDQYLLNNEDELKELAELIANSFKKNEYKNKFVNLKLAYIQTGSTCGVPWIVIGETSDGTEYVLDEKDEVLTDYVDYSYMGAGLLDVNYFVDLNGVVKTSDNNNKEVNLGVKANYIFSDYDGDDYVGDYILGVDNKLYSLKPGVVYTKDNILLRNVEVSKIHYKKNVKGDYESYDVIFTFKDNQALIIEDVIPQLRKF